MTALILLLIPAAILAIFLVPKSKSDIPDDVTVGAGDLFPKDGAIQLGAVQLGAPEDYGRIPYSFEDPTYIGMTLDSRD